MEKLTKAQLVGIQVMFNKLNVVPDVRTTMISGISGGRSTSSKDLSKKEAAYLISHLKGLDPEEQKAEKMRRKIISMAHELHWKIPGTTRIDMRRVDGWCKTFGFGKKSLNNYTPAELPKLVTQFEMGPYSHFFKR